jgi:pimeloyl-ACP methyl ester carboxylesterase
MRILLILLVSGLISACGTLQIEEKNFIRPDSLTGSAPKGRLDQAGLQAAVPNAKLSELSVPGPGDVSLHGVLMRRPDALAWVLYFGGNAFHLDEGAKVLATRLLACPVNIVVFDYRGYGRSGGMPTVANLQQDALTLFDHVNALFPGQVFVHGHSLGSFVAAYVAQHRPVRGLVLEATANNVFDWARANVPWYASAFVDLQVSESLKDIDNARALAQFTQPSLILAGGQDRVTPVRLGRKVFDALPTEAKQIVVVDAARHSDLLTHPQAVAAYCAMLR